jgi:hypothetical protein
MTREGLLARAEGLEQLLRALRTGDHERDVSALRAEELSWPVTAALTELLTASLPVIAPLSPSEAATLIQQATEGRCTLEQLAERGWLRSPLGRFQLPSGVTFDSAIADEDDDVVREALRALAALRPRISHDDERWIITQRADELLAKYPALKHFGVLRTRENGVALELYSEMFQTFGSRVAATAWIQSAGTDQRFAKWIGLVPSRWWVDAPTHLEASSKKELLDSMVIALRDDRDLKDWVHEIAFVVADSAGLRATPIVVAPPASTSLARYLWWQHLHARGRCRDDLACLVAAVVRGDEGQGPARFERIRKLLAMSAERAWLACVVPSDIAFHRPEVIASLLGDDEHAALAAVLLDEVGIPETSGDRAIDNTARRERYRTALWRELVPILVEGLALCAPREAARTLCQVVNQLITLSHRERLLDPQHQDVLVRMARERLELLSAELCIYRPRRSPRLLKSLLPAVADALRDYSYSHLPLHFWALKMAFGDDAATEAQIAVRISELFAVVIDAEVEAGEVIAWWRDDSELASLPWHLVFVASPAAAARILRPVEFPDRVARVPDVWQSLGTPRSSSIHALHAAWIKKQQLHIAILVHALDGLADPTLGSIEHLGLQRTLQGSLARRLAEDAVAAPSLFNGTPHTSSAPLALLAGVVRVVESMPRLVRDDCIDGWIQRTKDPVVVLGVAAVTRLDRLHEIAMRRVAQIDWAKVIEEEIWLPSVVRYAEVAIAASQFDTADMILAKQRALRPETWSEQTYLSRLVLAATRGSLESIDAVPAPRHHDDAAALKDLYRAIAQLETAPDRAREMFQALLDANALPAAAGVNRFAADLRIASLLPSADERASASSQALAVWERHAATLTADELQVVDEDASYYKLIALHTGGNHQAFEVTWARLASQQRTERRFLELAREHTAMAENSSLLAQAIAEAIAVHGEPIPAWLASLGEARASETTALQPSTLTELQLRAAVREALARPSESRASIFGSQPNTDMRAFLLEHHLTAASMLQRSEGLFSSLREEDKFSDVLIGYLRALLAPFGFEVHSQDRGGLSASTQRATTRGGVGERDWTIQSLARDLAIAEALRLTATTPRRVLTSHLDKLLQRYDRSGLETSFMIGYVVDRNFDAALDLYIDTVNAGIAPPLTETRSPGAFLRVFESTHARTRGRTTTVFHILVRVASAQRRG